MKKVLAVIVLLLVMTLGAGGAFYLRSSSRPAEMSLQERALAAYKSGNYKEAQPLFRDWAVSVKDNKQSLGVVMLYIEDISERLSAPTTKAPLDYAKVVANAPAMAAAAAAANDPPKASDRIPHKKPSPGEVVELTIKELGNFDFDPEKDADIPADCHLMDGAKVRLNGYMMPISQSEKISEFALMPSLVGCCFGQPPGPEHTITCTTPPDKAVNYEMDELVVEGTLHVRVRRQDNYTSSIWELDVRSVKIRE